MKMRKIAYDAKPKNVLRISVGRCANGRLTEGEAATQFCVELSRVRGYLEFE